MRPNIVGMPPGGNTYPPPANSPNCRISTRRISEASMSAVSILLFIPSVALWVAALFHVALKEPGSPFHYSGLNCLLLGWIGLISNPFWALPWLANVLYWISLITGAFRGTASGRVMVFSLVAIPM